MVGYNALCDSFPLIYLCMNRIFHATIMCITMNAAIMLIFIYAPTEKMQGIVQKIFYFHVSSAITMFVAFFVVCVASIMYLWKNSDWWDAIALSAAEIGVVFCTLVLITGPLWARPIWGTWWSWDPTLTLTLVLWLIYVAYLMLRIETYDTRRARFAAILGIIGFIDVLDPLVCRKVAYTASKTGTHSRRWHHRAYLCNASDFSSVPSGILTPLLLSLTRTCKRCAESAHP